MWNKKNINQTIERTETQDDEISLKIRAKPRMEKIS